MLSIREEDIQDGQYYRLKQHGEHTGWVILISNQSSTYMLSGKCIDNDGFTYYNDDGWGSYNQLKDIRLATPMERAHLDACIKAQKYIPIEKVKPVVCDNYNIY